jgi:hypothetical protein
MPKDSSSARKGLMTNWPHHTLSSSIRDIYPYDLKSTGSENRSHQGTEEPVPMACDLTGLTLTSDCFSMRPIRQEDPIPRLCYPLVDITRVECVVVLSISLHSRLILERLLERHGSLSLVRFRLLRCI